MIRAALRRLRRGLRPRALLDALLTYPRFLGTIKPALLGKSEVEFRARLASLGGAWWPRTLECPVGRRILVIAPHPDDETIGAGGLLLRHRGVAQVHLLNVFTGDGGGRLEDGEWSSTPEYRSRLVARRREELREAATRLGVASIHHLELPDGTTEPDPRHARRVRELLEAIDPDVVLLPWMLDAQPDHRLTNVLYASAAAGRGALVLAYEVWSQLPRPNAALDISEQLDEKLEIVRLFRTQTATVDYENLCIGLARLRGFQLGVRPDRSGAAEAFMVLPSGDYCELVRSLYGSAENLSAEGRRLLA
ncbi:MAG TPA: PIG-L family deacetylase [Gemmatimonadaceae bacterium]